MKIFTEILFIVKSLRYHLPRKMSIANLNMVKTAKVIPLKSIIMNLDLAAITTLTTTLQTIQSNIKVLKTSKEKKTIT